MRRTVVKFGFLVVPLLLAAVAPCAGQVSVMQLPAAGGADPAGRDKWAEAAVGELANGGAIENPFLLVIARPGAAGAVVLTKAADAPTRVELRLLAATGAAGKVGKVQLLRADEDTATLRLTAGAAAADITLAGARRFVQVTPAAGAHAVEVRDAARYAILPDFFGDDVVYDPRRFAADELSLPAENFLFDLAGDGSAMVMSLWAGELAGAKPAGGKPAEARPESAAPQQVTLLLAGAGDGRRIAGHRIELAGRPVYVAILEQKDLWHDEPVAAWPGCKPTAIPWRRPFEGQWRADLLVAEGRQTTDWHTRSQSFRVNGPVAKGQPAWWSSRGSEDNPVVWQEALMFMTYPAWFKGSETMLCLYADLAERRKAEAANKAEQARAAAARKEGTPYAPKPEIRPPNIYDHVLVYPLDRVRQTPLTVLTPVDIMRDTFGQGPCEYILDLEGIRPRPAGGRRELLADATCPLWDNHIFPIISRKLWTKSPDGRLDEKTRTHLVQALEDIVTFVHAVHDRIREYRKWAGEMAAFCKDAADKSGAVKQAAAPIAELVAELDKDAGRMKFTGPGTEGWWADRIAELIRQVNDGKYDEVAEVAKVRNLGNSQDQMVARCRRYVKGMRQEAFLIASTDPAVRRFAKDVIARCQSILRNKHPKEGL